MSDEKKYTERDLALAKREAFEAGVKLYVEALPSENQLLYCGKDIATVARHRYPLTVTRPRTVKDSVTYEWRVVNGAFEFKSTPNSPWRQSGDVLIRPRDVAKLADLLANPTETVEE